MAKIAKKKAPGRVAATRGSHASKGEFSRVKIQRPAVRLKAGEAETIRKAVHNYYKRTRTLEKL
jgi:hypothetical protein